MLAPSALAGPLMFADVSAPDHHQRTVRGDLRHEAKRVYRRVVKHQGKRAPGRNIARYGVRTRHGSRAATVRDLRTFVDTLRLMLHPPPAAPVIAAGPVISAPATSANYGGGGGGGGMPYCTYGPESGGNYNAVNPSSGAYGKYQIMPSTWAAQCSGISKDPSGQETCARRVMAAQGAGAWVNC